MSKEKFYFSYSSLQKLINDPKVFHKEYILKERDILDKTYFKKGGILHCLMLEPEKFDELFIVMPEKLPTESGMKVIRAVFNEHIVPRIEDQKIIPFLDAMGDEVLQQLEEINLYQSMSDDKKIDKVINQPGIDFYNALVESTANRKEIVDMKVAQQAHEQAKIMKANKQLMDLLTENNKDEVVRTEMELSYDIPGHTFGLKGFIDAVKVDYKNETLHLIDLKTTSKTLEAWRKSFDTSMYMYWLQVVVYKELLLSLVPKDSKKAWTLKVWYPVIDKDNNVYCFPVSTNSLKKWELMTKGVFEIAEWHLENEKFDLPYEYEQGLVEL